jgi:hypothetical protein
MHYMGWIQQVAINQAVVEETLQDFVRPSGQDAVSACPPAILLQVTRKLSALLFQALQQPDPLFQVPSLAAFALVIWLSKVSDAIKAPTAPRAAAAALQQLQDVQLLQHLGPAMDAATARLTSSPAAIAEAVAAAGSSSSTVGASTTQQASILLQHITSYGNAEKCCLCLLQTFNMASCVMPTRDSPLVATTVVLAAPAAVRMALTIFQNHDKIQQLKRQQDTGSPTVSLAQGTSELLLAAIDAMTRLIAACEGHGDMTSMLQSLPAASELVQMPEFVSCLAIMAVATALGVDTSSDGRTSTAAAPAAGRSRGGGGSASRRVPSAGRQQQATQQAGSSSGSAGSNDGGLSNGVRLDSLTPLSCTLFGILGVTKATAVLFARLARSQGITYPYQLQGVLRIYKRVIKYQVSVCFYV